MQAILDRLIEKVILAPIDTQPSENIYMEDVFEPSVYHQILLNLPPESLYNNIDHPDAILPDKTITRKLLDLSPETLSGFPKQLAEFWSGLYSIFSSKDLQDILVKKFSARIKEKFGLMIPEMVTVPILYRDFPGYHISIHTDAPYKIATMQFYLPKDNSQIHLGTSFHQRENNQFYELKRNLFKPNSAYAFVRTDTSWHSVNQMGAHEAKRDTLALTIYQKGYEYQSIKPYS